MNSSSLGKTLILTLLALGLVSCVSPPAPDGSPSSAPASTGGEAIGSGAGESAGPAAAGGDDGNAAPEFKAVRAAIQPVTEIVPELGKKLEGSCAKAETAIAAGASSTADRHLVEMLQGLAGASEIPGDVSTGVYAALAKDAAAVADRAGAPKITVTETKDKCCGASGSCDTDSAGATCFTATLAGNEPLCACRVPQPDPVEEAPPAAGDAAEAAAPEGEAKGDEKAAGTAEKSESAAKPKSTKKRSGKK